VKLRISLTARMPEAKMSACKGKGGGREGEGASQAIKTFSLGWKHLEGLESASTVTGVNVSTRG